MVIVAGEMVLRAGTFGKLKPAMLAMLATSRAEAGCRVYSYGVDVEDPNVIRVYEEWESREAFAAHVEAAHFKDWRRRVGEVGIERRDIRAFEAGAEVAFQGRWRRSHGPSPYAGARRPLPAPPALPHEGEGGLR